MKTKLTFLMALPLLVSLACGGKSDAEKFADEFCGEVSKCCSQQGLPSEGQLCKMLMGMVQGYNATAGEACLAEMRAQVSAGTFCQSGTSDQSPCSSVYANATGSSKPGEACEFPSDCAESNEGEVTCAGVVVNGTSERKCQVRIVGKAGEACTGTQDGDTFVGLGGDDLPSRAIVCHISDGLHCDGSTCVALAAVGGSCYSSSDCVRSAYCDSSQRKCAARIANDAACTGRAYDNDCVTGSYCSSTNQRCTPQLANGASCSSSDMCLAGSCNGTVCADFGIGLALTALCTDSSPLSWKSPMAPRAISAEPCR